MRSIRTTNNNRRRKAAYHPLPAAVLQPNGMEPRDAELGEFVKIGFSAEGAATEWMWAKVVEKAGSDYVVVMRNSAFSCAVTAGSRIAITSADILTTWDDCPLRAAQDLEPLGGGWGERLDRLRAFEAETGLGRRDAVARMLADLPKAA